MTALIAAGAAAKRSALRSITVPLASGANMKAWRGGMACFDTATGTWKPGIAATSTLIRAGQFAQDFDNSAGSSTAQVLVDLDYEIFGTWWDNATGGAAIAAANLFQDAYILDNHTVTVTAGSNGKAGRAWRLSADGTKVLCVPYQI